MLNMAETFTHKPKNWLSTQANVKSTRYVVLRRTAAELGRSALWPILLRALPCPGRRRRSTRPGQDDIPEDLSNTFRTQDLSFQFSIN